MKNNNFSYEQLIECAKGLLFGKDYLTFSLIDDKR